MSAALALLGSPLVRYALVGLALLAVVVGLIEKGKSMARAEQAAAVAAAQKKADELSAQIIVKQQEADAARQGKVIEYVTQIKTVPADPNCPADAGDRAASRSVRDLLGSPKAK